MAGVPTPRAHYTQYPLILPQPALGAPCGGAQRDRWLLPRNARTMQFHLSGERAMSRDVIKSQWTRLSGKLRAKWTKLTYEDVLFGEGDRSYLVGRLRARYGIDDAAAQKQVAAFERMLS